MIDERDLPHAVYPDPNKLYQQDPNYVEPLLKKYAPLICGPVFGILFQWSNNWMYGRPYRTGIHRYVIFVALSTAAGYGLRYYIDSYTSYRDRVYKHYIATHPEDFPLPPKIRVAEKWEPWLPSR